MRERILVVGGNAAGMTAAGRAKRLQPDLDITILEASSFISYSICGVPYWVSGLVGSHQDLIAYTPQRLAQERGIQARCRTRVEAILPGRRRLACRSMDSDETFQLDYDRLVLSTGYRPVRPRIEGCELGNVFTVSRLEDGRRLRECLQRRPAAAAVVGGGYIGLMMAAALAETGVRVTLFEKGRHVFSAVDDEIAERIEGALTGRGIAVKLRCPVRALHGTDGMVRSVACSEGTVAADLVLIDVGVLPRTELAQEAGIALGISGAISVDRRGQTDLPGIYAAGNCAETVHLVTNEPVFSTLGTSAARQGRVVGENLAGLRSEYPGTLETALEKVFDLSVGRTGLTLRQALLKGYAAKSVTVDARDRAAYFPDSGPVRVTLVYESGAGRLLGAQIAGGADAAKRIDSAALAIQGRLTVRDLAQADFGYAPPFATLWDPLQIAAHIALR